jgi:hypothetical protein
MSGLDDRLHGFRECRESGANEAQRQLRGKHFNTVIDKYWPSAADGCPTTRQDRYRPVSACRQRQLCGSSFQWSYFGAAKPRPTRAFQVITAANKPQTRHISINSRKLTTVRKLKEWTGKKNGKNVRNSPTANTIVQPRIYLVLFVKDWPRFHMSLPFGHY